MAAQSSGGQPGLTPQDAWTRVLSRLDPDHPLADGRYGPVRFSLLQEGPVNGTWRVERGDHKAFLRIGGPLARRLGLDRQAETEVLAAVASAGFGPACLAADTNGGLLLTEWLPGSAWTERELADPVNLGRAGRFLARLHALPPAGSTVDYAAEARCYAGLAGEHHNDRCRMALDILARLEPGPRVLTHRDTVAANFVADGTVLRMVDWEYAGLGSRWFDLAVLSVHLGLDPSDEKLVLAAYLGASEGEFAPPGTPSTTPEWARDQLAGWKDFYAVLHKLWLAATAVF